MQTSIIGLLEGGEGEERDCTSPLNCFSEISEIPQCLLFCHHWCRHNFSISSYSQPHYFCHDTLYHWYKFCLAHCLRNEQRPLLEHVMGPRRNVQGVPKNTYGVETGLGAKRVQSQE
ncbi:unnamed protein product [Ixodes persulcatus]